MQPTSSATPDTDGNADGVRRGLVFRGLGAASALCVACGATDGVIGAVPSGDASRPPTFEAQFAAKDPIWQSEGSLPGAGATVGDARSDAVDGRAATLIFPGHPEYGANEGVGPDLSTSLASSQRFGFGTYRSRIAFGACASNEEVAQAVLGYFNDGADHNGNAITDEVEIDFQVLCGSPTLAYLTVFTDYDESGGEERFRKLSHVVDFSSGATYDTPSDRDDAFVAGPVDASWRQPELIAAGKFYELGFEWHAGSIRFFIDAGAGEMTLWTLSDPAHVPSQPVQLIYNAWHPDSHWFPLSNKADFPAEDVILRVDWFRYYAE
jgi:hypothetical protein